MNAGCCWWRVLYKNGAHALLLPVLLSWLLSLSKLHDHTKVVVVCVSCELISYQPPGTLIMAGLAVLAMPLIMRAVSHMTGGSSMGIGAASAAAVAPQVDVADVAVKASHGCSRDSQVQIDTTLNVTLGDRRYLLYFPVNYQPDKPAPLVLSYHGGTRTAETQQALDLLTTTYFNQDYIVVYPNGINVS